MPPVETVPRRQLLHETARDLIKQYIINSGLQPGDALPSEGEIARMLGISRASLREAMRSLQAIGIVETVHGEGTFVGNPSFSAMEEGIAFQISIQHGADMQRKAQSLYELMVLRELLESSAVARLAPFYDASDLNELVSITEQMKASAASGQDFKAEDIRFHEVLYRRAGNAMLQQLIRAFFDICDHFRHPNPAPEFLRLNAHNHAVIVQALMDRNGDEAERAMRRHFVGLASWFDAQGNPLVFIGQTDRDAKASEP